MVNQIDHNKVVVLTGARVKAVTALPNDAHKAIAGLEKR